MRNYQQEIPNFGDVFLAELETSENIQGGFRPVLISQNNRGNKYSPTVEVIPMSSRTTKATHMPTHVIVEANQINGLPKDSVVLAEQTTTIHKKRLKRKLGKLGRVEMIDVGRARAIQSPFPNS